MNYYIHETPGRIRVRTPMLKNDRRSASKALTLVQAMPGVRSVRIGLATGSLTVHFASDVFCPSKLINLLVRYGYLTGLIGFPRRPSPHGRRENWPL